MRWYLPFSGVIVSLVFYAVLVWIGGVKMYSYYAPFYNACSNLFSLIFIIVGFFKIKRGKVSHHKLYMQLTLMFSTMFFTSYILYHLAGEEVRYAGPQPLRYIYLGVLFPHILTAVISLPVALIAYYFALRENFTKHKKIASFLFPVWVFTMVTGVVVFLMMLPYYLARPL